MLALPVAENHTETGMPGMDVLRYPTHSPASRAALSAALRLALSSALLAACLSVPAPARADEGGTDLRHGDCGTASLKVWYIHRIDFERACEAWRRVTGFLLVPHGLRVAAPIDITFADRVEIEVAAECFRVLGFHNRATRAIQITSATSDWLREPDRLMFRRPVDAELHIGLIVHELVHAVVKDNYRGIGEPGHAASEYLAYTVQLATTEAGALGSVLAGYDNRDFASPAEINDICHAVQPHEFGVRAYRHFVREGHAYMVETILSGRLQTDLPLP